MLGRGIGDLLMKGEFERCANLLYGEETHLYWLKANMFKVWPWNTPLGLIFSSVKEKSWGWLEGVWFN